MFTGIIEDLGSIEKLEREGQNLHITVKSKLSSELKIDQSVAHNGVCLTVVELEDNSYKVTAIDETLKKTNLDELKKGDLVNLEADLMAKYAHRLLLGEYKSENNSNFEIIMRVVIPESANNLISQLLFMFE